METTKKKKKKKKKKKHVSICLFDVPTACRLRVAAVQRLPVHHHSADFTLFPYSTVILSLPLIQEGQLSVSGERMCTILVNCLED